MLPDVERFRLLHGPYQPPKCKVGGWLNCRRRGRVKVVAFSNGPIAWPMTRPVSGPRSMILCGDLVKAVRQETSLAIQHWWGVNHSLVQKWRRILGVEHDNEATKQLRAKWMREGGIGEIARPAHAATYSSPERVAEIGAKISALKKGKPRPPHIAEAVRKARTGARHTEESRRKMSEAVRRHLAISPRGYQFTAEEDALLGTMPDREVAEKTGHGLMMIFHRRQRLGIPSFRPYRRAEQ